MSELSVRNPVIRFTYLPEGYTSSVIEHREMSWSDFDDFLMVVHLVAGKAVAPCILPCTLKVARTGSSRRTKTGRRRVTDADQAHLIIGDIDHGKVDLHVLEAAVTADGVAAIIFPTWKSGGLHGQRWRVVVFLAEPIKARDYKCTRIGWARSVERRLMAMGEPSPERGVWHMRTKEGLWLQPEPLLYLGLTNGDLSDPLGYGPLYARGNSNRSVDADGNVIESGWDAFNVGMGMPSTPARAATTPRVLKPPRNSSGSEVDRMGGAAVIECAEHGTREETFVCQHIAFSLTTRKPVGFFWADQTAKDRSDAWCFECNERVKQTGGEWVGEAGRQLGVKLICAGCYDDAKEMALGKGGSG